MSDTTVVTDKKDEEKVEKPLGVEVREKSFHQILKEQSEERTKPADEAVVVETEEEKKAKDDKVAVEAEEAKAKEEADKKAEEDKQAAIASKAAEDVLKKQDEERQRVLDEEKAKEEAKKREEDLKPKFTGKDKDGNVVPQSYEEITAEAARIGREEAIAEMEAREKARSEEAAKVAQEKTQTEEQVKARQQAISDELQKELDADLSDLYANDKLPKIKDPKDENDPGNKEFKNLFETAQKVNADRMAKGEPPIRSIKLIYYEHYKPLTKPAGSDAPVMGAESAISNELPDDKYIPARDRNKSMAQLLKEEAQRLSKKMNIRSN